MKFIFKFWLGFGIPQNFYRILRLAIALNFKILHRDRMHRDRTLMLKIFKAS